MKNLKKKYFIGILLISFLSFCKKPKPYEPVESQQSKGVFICNEGNYTYGNATLSFYDPETKTIDNTVFYSVNNFPLGDVCLSMAIKDTLGFLVINNSGKILVMNTNTFKHIATISGLTSPRYIQFISDTKAYVTDLYNKNMTIFNPKTYSITGSVTVGNSTEQLVKSGDFVYVTSWSYNNKVYKIDSRSDILVDSLTLTKQPNSIVPDKNIKLWVLSDGGFSGIPGGQEIAALTKIDAATFKIEQIINFSSAEDSPNKLKINGTKDTLYFINSTWGIADNSKYGVYRMPVNSTNLPNAAFIKQSNHLFYGLGVDPETSDIYVSDAVDYLQKGIVFHYKSNATLIDSFKTDIIPSYFAFKK